MRKIYVNSRLETGELVAFWSKSFDWGVSREQGKLIIEGL